MSSALRRFAVSSRNWIISLNFQPVSMCSSGKGMRPGKNALRARCSSTEESLPMEYMSSGLANSAATSRMMWMLSASRRARWVRRAAAALRRPPGTGLRVVTGCTWACIETFPKQKYRPRGRLVDVPGTVRAPTGGSESTIGYAGITAGLRAGWRRLGSGLMTPFRRRILLLGLLMGLGTAQTAPNPLPALSPLTSRDTLLIVAPHPDDESLCCAGLIHMARQAGAQVAIVWITNGDGFRWDAMVTQRALFPDSGSYRTLAHTRIQEARNAAQSLGVAPDSLYFLGYPDRGVLHLMRDYYQPQVPWRSRYTGARAVIYPDAFEPGAPYEGDRLVRNFNAVLDRVKPTLVFA